MFVGQIGLIHLGCGGSFRGSLLRYLLIAGHNLFAWFISDTMEPVTGLPANTTGSGVQMVLTEHHLDLRACSNQRVFTQSWFIVGPASQTMAQHETNIGSMSPAAFTTPRASSLMR